MHCFVFVSISLVFFKILTFLSIFVNKVGEAINLTFAFFIFEYIIFFDRKSGSLSGTLTNMYFWTQNYDFPMDFVSKCGRVYNKGNDYRQWRRCEEPQAPPKKFLGRKIAI